jgi:virginiamycin A acetyltransferase
MAAGANQEIGQLGGKINGIPFGSGVKSGHRDFPFGTSGVCMHFCPTFLRQYLRERRLSARYPGRQILTADIHETASLGAGCYLGRDVEIGRHVKIGDHTYVNKNTVICSGEIGRFCSIGYYCQIGMYQHPLHRISSSSRLYGDFSVLPGKKPFHEVARPPVVEHDVWIASHVHVMQGIRIGTGAVIAAGAVVTSDVPPYSIAGGVPSKVIRKRFDDRAIELLLQSRWWERSPEELAQWEDLLTSDDWQGKVPEEFLRRR